MTTDRNDSSTQIRALESEPLRIGSKRTGRFIPIGVKFAFAVLLTLTVIALAVGLGLSRVARQGLVQSKLRGAQMIVDNVAQAMVPALDFGDATAVTEYAERLKATRDVSRVIVWNELSVSPIFSKPTGNARPPTKNEYLMSPTEIILTRLLVTPVGEPTGRLQVHFSLGPENLASRRLRTKILGFTAFVALAVAAIMVVVARFTIVGRVKQLLSAMSQVRFGGEVVVDAETRDEIGELAHGFNEMALAIRDRERNLSIERDSRQELLDNMQQAILVAGPGGQLSELRSRETERLFGKDRLGPNLVDLLCDASRPAIERQAFTEWIELAFKVPHDGWSQMSELAPSEATIVGIDGVRRYLKLDMRPIFLEDRLLRIMCLCTDLTAQRLLERTVEEHDAAHDGQMRVMRTMLAGSGQQLVQTLKHAESRLDACSNVLSRTTLTRADVDEIFQYVHSVKGDASAFELESLVQVAAAMETELGSLRAEIQHDACPEPVVVLQRLHDGLAQMSAAVQGARSMLVEASPIGEAILDQVTVRNRDLVALDQACVHVGRETRDVVDRLLAQPFGDLIVCMPAATQRWSEKLSKQVALEVEGRHVPVPRNLVQVLPAAIAQLVRNAVSHGIESPTQRLSSGKPEVGLIQLQCRETATDIEVHVIDDGCGLDEHRLNAARDVSGAARLGAVDTAFISGVSTADDATIRSGVAGCGVGLSAVRAELAQLGYCIELQTEAGRGVHVRLYRNDTAQRESSA